MKLIEYDYLSKNNRFDFFIKKSWLFAKILGLKKINKNPC